MAPWNTKGRRFCINTFESILSRLKRNYTGQASTLEGTIVGDIFLAVANELARIYSQELAPMEDNLFLQTALGDRLDALCGNYSILRQENESDDALRTRALKQIREPALAGNAAHYAAWASEVPGVKAACAVAGVRGAGTVDVYYVPTADAPTGLWEHLQQHLEEQCPLSAEVLALEAMPYSLTITASVDLKETALLEEVRGAFSAALTEYFSRISLTEEGNRISPSRLTAMLLDCAGVLDVNSFSINERDVTLILPDGSYPHLEALDLRQELIYE